MGSIVAVVDLKNQEAEAKAAKILGALTHRGPDRRCLVRNGQLIEVEGEPDKGFEGSPYAIGFNASKRLGDEPPPGEVKMILDGELYGDSVVNWKNVKAIVEEDTRFSVGLERVVRVFDGAYAMASMDQRGIHACRDPLGLKPLYYGSKCGVHALSSERKGLWVLGIRDAYPVPPGSTVTLNRDVEVNPVFPLVRSSRRIARLEEAVNQTVELLRMAVKRRIDVDRVAVAFSGGLDSSLIAYLLKEMGLKVQLYTASIGSGVEVGRAVEAAEALGFPLTVVEVPVDEVESYVSRVLWLMEDPNPLKVEIAVPILVAAEHASRDGFNTLFLGQGGDELYAGYKRFEEMYRERGEAWVEHEVYVSVAESYLNNFQRDEPLLTASTVRGRYPFYDLQLVSHALSIPAFMNLPGLNGLRKGVLRLVGKALGLPSKVYQAPKKAVQYGSGSHQAIRQLARRQGLTPAQFLKKLFDKMFHSKPQT